MDEVVAFLIPITLFLVVGGVLILRPITTRMGALLEAMALEKRRAQDSVDTAKLRDTITALESRIALLEERQNFTESLLASGNHRPRAALAREADPRLPDLVP